MGKYKPTFLEAFEVPDPLTPHPSMAMSAKKSLKTLIKIDYKIFKGYF